MMKKTMGKIRLAIQVAFTALTNGYAAGFLKGGLYQGDLKFACLPGLNCYACPGALGSCPIGSLQAVLRNRDYMFSFYVVGFLALFGALLGRLVCGFLCPFGLVQDLLHKIPVPHKKKNLPGAKYLRYLKYVLLLLFVVILPLTAVNIIGQGDSWFCKYVCPSGTLMGGIPQITLNESLRSGLGLLFGWKLFILVGIAVLSVFFYRPFCKYLCPLGAIYGFFNKISLYRYRVDLKKCTGCGACAKVCKMGVDIRKSPDSMECIRCGDCRGACPVSAISRTVTLKNQPSE